MRRIVNRDDVGNREVGRFGMSACLAVGRATFGATIAPQPAQIIAALEAPPVPFTMPPTNGASQNWYPDHRHQQTR